MDHPFAGINYIYKTYKNTNDWKYIYNVVNTLSESIKRDERKTRYIVQTILRVEDISKHDDILDSVPFMDYDKAQEKQASKLKNRRVLAKKKKNITITIENMEIDLIPAMKCTLWSLGNKPSTTFDIYKYIVFEGKKLCDFSREDHLKYNTDKIRNCNEFILDKTKKDNVGRTIFLYSNPTDKRQGYFYKGSLYTLKELSEMSGVLPVTIHRRFDKMSMECALGK